MERQESVQDLYGKIIIDSYKTEKYPPVITELPSKGLVYPSETFFGKTGFAVYRKMTGRDEEFATDPIYSTQYLLNFMFQTQFLFNEAPYESISIENFLIADRDTLVLNQRLVSYGTKLAGARMTCKYCEEPIKLEEDLTITNYEIERLNPDTCRQVEPNKNAFLYVSKDGKWQVVFRFLTVKDEQELINNADQSIYDGYGYSMMSFMLKSVISINGVSEKPDVYGMFRDDEFPVIEYRKLHQYLRKITPHIMIHTSEVECRTCGKSNNIRADVDLKLLEINNRLVRDIMTEEMLVLHHQAHIGHSDIYEMPTEFRKRLFNREMELLKPKDSNQNPMQKIPG